VSTISSFSVQEVFSDPIARNRKEKKKIADCVLIRSRLPGVLVLEKAAASILVSRVPALDYSLADRST
jgi:hypothetical protein